LPSDRVDPGTGTSSGKVPFWLDPAKRGIIYQVVVLCLVGLLGYYIISNTQANLQRQSIATGFGFFKKEASFEIGESLIPYSAANTYARALFVGVLNTLKVAFIGIVLTIILGTFIGIARLSTNFLISKLAAIYIEVMQNIPVLLQLFFWYSIFYETLPSPRNALNPINGVFLNNRGLSGYFLPYLRRIPHISSCFWPCWQRAWLPFFYADGPKKDKMKPGSLSPYFLFQQASLWDFP